MTDHLQTFNFGRSVGRLEARQHLFWLRVRWLLVGGSVGVALAAAYVQIVLHNTVPPIMR